MTTHKLSVAIPTHDMPNKQYFFRRCLDSLWYQTFQDFEIVVTDNSDDDGILEVCDWYRTGIRYIKNPNKGMAQNTNEAIRQSEGELIKILYMDDFMEHEESLEGLVKKIQDQMWLVSGCIHTTDGINRLRPHVPRYNKRIVEGENTIGSPSVLTIRNKDPLLFDENMTWLLDCDLYKRYYDLYGDPVILNNINVVIGLGKHQMTNVIEHERKLSEYRYMIKKYE